MILLAPTTAALLLFGSGVAFRVDSVVDVDGSTAEALTDVLSSTVRARTGREVVIDDPLWRCESADRCIGEIRARTRMEEVVLIRMLGGPTRIQVDAERFSPRIEGSRGASVRIPRQRETWSSGALDLAETLFEPAPLVVEHVPSDTGRTSEPTGSSTALLSWALIGTGVAAATIGAVLGARSAAASREIRTKILQSDQRDALARRQKDLGLAANILFGAAALTAVTGALTWVF